MSDGYQALPFSQKKQDALLGHLLQNDNFFKLARGRIEPGWFVDVFASKIWGIKQAFYKKYGRAPTIQEIKENPDLMADEQAVRNKVYAKIDQCRLSMDDFGLDSLSDELSGWLKARTFDIGVNKSVDTFNTGKVEDAYTLLDKAVRDIKESRFESEKESIFDDYVSDFEASVSARSGALTIGNTLIDRLILPDATGGCLLPGDTTVIIAPTGTGKTTQCITTAAANIKRSKSVLFMIHEGRESDIKEKIWCAMLGVDKPTLFSMYKTEEGVRKIQFMLPWLKRYLKLVPIIKAGLTWEEVEITIRRKQDERIAKYGKPFDIIVDDYPAKMGTIMAKGGLWAKRTIDDHVYGEFVAIGGEYGSHMFLPIQTNREGSKVNKGMGNVVSRVVVAEDVSESFGVPQQAANIITLNRNSLAKRMNLITIFIDKSRSSETGYCVVCRSDYAKATICSDELGAFWYQGTNIMTDDPRVPDWIKQHKNAALPEYLLIDSGAR